MAIHNILLAYNGSASSEAALRMAVCLHKAYGSHITGLFVHGQSRVQRSLRSWMPSSVHSALLTTEESHYDKIKTRFEQLTGTINADYCHWIGSRGETDVTVAEYARMYDLTLLGRYDALLGAEHLTLHPKEIIHRSGRPVLMVPKAWDEETLGDEVILAWDGLLPSAKALNAALPILQTKKTVTVLSLEDGEQGKPLPGISVYMVLERHGITVKKATIKASKHQMGKRIIDYCNASQAGLLVLGVLERSVLHETLFGDINRMLARQTHLPVLMSR